MICVSSFVLDNFEPEIRKERTHAVELMFSSGVEVWIWSAGLWASLASHGVVSQKLDR
jgi:hypothetical protein